MSEPNHPAALTEVEVEVEVEVEPCGAELEAADARAIPHSAALAEAQNARERSRVVHRHELNALRAAEPTSQLEANGPARKKLSFVQKTLRKIAGSEVRLRETLGLRLARAGRLGRDARSDAAEASSPGIAESKPLRVEPIAARPRQPVHSERPLLLCLSHVAPWPPRAGNEYRIHRVLKWAKHAGYDLAVVLCPLPGEEPTKDAEAVLADIYDNLLVVDRRGQIRHAVSRADLASAVDALVGRKPGRYACRNERFGDKLNEILNTFAPDSLLELLREVDHRKIAEVYWVNYGFMSRAFDVIESDALTLIDTHDVFSTKAAKVSRFGIHDDLGITAAEEGLLLDGADIVVAIQGDEARELEAIVRDKPVVTVGVDMERTGAVAPPVTAPVLLMVASNNAMNRKGLVDFLRFAWPRIRQAVPNAELHVVGAVGQNLTGAEPGVVKLGFVDNLEEVYDRARLVINPAVAGTGLKIKTLEALVQLKPVVLWPSGLDGVSPELRKYCSCVRNWYDFGVSVIKLLRDEASIQRMYADRLKIAQCLSPDHVYRDLKRVIDERKA